MISADPSCDPSSTMMNSKSPNCCWSTLSIASLRKRSPLYTPITTLTVGDGIISRAPPQVGADPLSCAVLFLIEEEALDGSGLTPQAPCRAMEWRQVACEEVAGQVGR